ncbi:MAG: SDR family NAD(P)-dependent oxidoreductase [Myxococcota bacterium]
MSVVGWFSGRGPTGFGYDDTAELVSAGVDLTGKRYLVTGAGSGLGFETARVLALRGATVVAAARTDAAAEAACRGIGAGAVPVACDLSEPASVRACVAAVRSQAPLDGIVANAGVMAVAEREVKHGHEIQFLTNHLGHFVLVTGLVERLTPSGRVVVLSSAAHTRAPPSGIVFDDLSAERWYTPFAAYGQSKLANLLFARALSKRLDGGRTANAVHPGVIRTNLGRHMNPAARWAMAVLGPLALKSVPQGAATQTFVAVSPAAASVSGEYWADSNVKASSALGADLALAERLWTETERIVAGL